MRPAKSKNAKGIPLVSALRNLYRIQAAVLRASGGPLKIESVEIEGPRDDEVLVRIVSSGICRTDIDFIDDWEGDPVVLGHEGAGVVEVAGKNVKGVKPGDHVVLSYQSCGSCPECRKGHSAGCEHFYDLNFGFARMDGSNAYAVSGVRGHFFGQSSFATHALATGHNLVKVPKDLDLSLLAPLGCGLQTGAGTVMNSLKVRKGASIAVFGTGSVGLAAVMAARIVGAYPIIGIDKNPKRLELALQIGATDVINSRRQDILSSLARIAGHGVDYALEVTGDQTMHRLAIAAVKPKGIVALIAEPGGSESLPGGGKVIGIIQGDAVPQRFIPRLIELYREGRFPFDRLVRFYDFKEINEAIADSRKGDTIKPVLRIGEI
jgi:aryl-alcohol dehydrogenase